MPFAATWKDPELIILSNVRRRQISHHLYVESKIMLQMKYLQNRNKLTDLENEFMITEGKDGEKV